MLRRGIENDFDGDELRVSVMCATSIFSSRDSVTAIVVVGWEEGESHDAQRKIRKVFGAPHRLAIGTAVVRPHPPPRRETLRNLELAVVVEPIVILIDDIPRQVIEARRWSHIGA